MVPDAPLHHLDKGTQLARLGLVPAQRDGERGQRRLEAVGEIGDVTACALDAASATKIVSTASAAGLGPWRTGGFTSTSLALFTPTTLRKLQENEVYRVDLVWTLNSGP